MAFVEWVQGGLDESNPAIGQAINVGVAAFFVPALVRAAEGRPGAAPLSGLDASAQSFGLKENSCVCGFRCLRFLAPGCWNSGFQMFSPSPMFVS
jgi:hypothetical protein